MIDLCKNTADAIGTWLHVEICIEGLPITAMVDTLC